MCDTLVALGNATKDGNVVFAKNSDRQPNEPHLVLRVPRQKFSLGAKVKCTYIEINQVPETYEVLLLKPSWIWGAEMGSNEWGLNIGNEAVFTKEKQGEPSLLGMDMLRLALERCKTAMEAVHLVIDLLEKHGQGGNCGYEKPLVYHNSFLIADTSEAWLLETAGRYWVAERVKDIHCISNRLSIGKDYDLAHPDLIGHAMEKGWCKKESDFHFAKCYSNPIFTYFSGSNHRNRFCRSQLEKAKGSITTTTMMEILRGHEPKVVKNPYAQHSLKSVCMHGGFLFGDHTTGSYVASIGETHSTYWITGSSTPCLSTFKPYWLLDQDERSANMVFPEAQQNKAIAFWGLRERLHRMAIEGKLANLDEYLTARDELEAELVSQVETLGADYDNSTRLIEIMEHALLRETQLVEKTIAENKHNRVRIKGNPYFKLYWKKQNKRLGGI